MENNYNGYYGDQMVDEIDGEGYPEVMQEEPARVFEGIGKLFGRGKKGRPQNDDEYIDYNNGGYNAAPNQGYNGGYAPQQPAPQQGYNGGYAPQQPAPNQGFGGGYAPQQPAPQQGYNGGYAPQQPAPQQGFGGASDPRNPGGVVRPAAQQAGRPAPAPVQQPARPAARPVGGMPRIAFFSPTAFDDRIRTEVGEVLKRGNVINLTLAKAPDLDSRRILDFLSGVLFGIDGTCKCLDQDAGIYLFLPAGVTIDDYSVREVSGSNDGGYDTDICI